MNFNSDMGINTSKMIKPKGTMKRKETIILLDSDTTHYFILKRLVEKLKIPIQPAKFVVVLRHNGRVKGLGRCNEIVVTFQGIIVVQDFLPFQLGRFDIILGIDWLSQLGEVKVN